MIRKFKNILLLLILIISPLLFSGCSCDFSFLLGKKGNISEPNLYIDYTDQTITWYNTDDTDLYDIYLNGSIIDTINATTDVISYDYSDYITDNTTYTFNVVAKSLNSKYADSLKSNGVTVNNTKLKINDQISKYTFAESANTVSINSNIISWSEISTAYKYIISIYTNETGLIQIEQEDTMFYLSNQSIGLGKEHQIVAYNVGYITNQEDYEITLLSNRIQYYNPDEHGIYTGNVFAFEEKLYDYYINTEEELNALVYYNFINRVENYDLRFDSNYVHELISKKFTDATTVVTNQIEEAFSSFYETCYYKLGNFKENKSYSAVKNLSTLDFSISIDFCDIYECDITKNTITYSNNLQSATITPYYETYNFTKNGYRSQTYDDFESDQYFITQTVSTSEQLYHAVENNITPICDSGSRAETIYTKAKNILREIISDNMTDYEKVLSIFDWITFNTIYDYSSEYYSDDYVFTQDCCYYLEGVFIKNITQNGNTKGIAVCDGFSKAFSLLCNMEGIDCKRIVGTAKTSSSSGGHAWNKVKLDNNYYLVDITWTEVIATESNNVQQSEILSHKYFLVSDYTVANTHEPYDKKLSYTEYATPLTSNNIYYKNTNLNYTDFDEDNQIINKSTNLYIDSSDKLEDVLNYALYKNADNIEIAVDLKYLEELCEKFNENNYLSALQFEMRSLKYPTQLISHIFDTSNNALNLIPQSQNQYTVTMIINTSLFVNDFGEIEDTINQLGNMANCDSSVLSNNYLIAIDRDYMMDVLNINVSFGIFHSQFEKYLKDFVATIEYTCDFSLIYTYSFESFKVSTEEGIIDSFVYYCYLNVSNPLTVTQLNSPTLTINEYNLTWNSVENAKYYCLFQEDNLIATIENDGSNTYSFNLDDYFNENGEYTISIIAYNDSKLFINSEKSSINYSHIELIKLETPTNVVLQNSIISWNNVENALYYKIYINGTHQADTYVCYYDLAEILNDAGTYEITVIAIGDPETTINSDFSNSVIFKRLDAPNVSLNENELILNWNKVTNAGYYEIYIDGNFVESTTTLNYTLQINDYIKHKVFVLACANSYYPSAIKESNTLEFQLNLPAVNITLYEADAIVAWYDMPYVESYELYINNVLKETIIDNNTTLYTINLLDYCKFNGRYNIYIVCNALSGYLDSDSSNYIEFVYEAGVQTNITEPSISLDWETETLSWESITDATSYTIYIDNTFTQTTSNTSIKLNNLVTDFKQHEIYITCTDGQAISDKSNVVLYEKTNTNSYIEIGNSKIYKNTTIAPEVTLAETILNYDAVVDLKDYFIIIYDEQNKTTYYDLNNNKTFNLLSHYNNYNLDNNEIIAYHVCTELNGNLYSIDLQENYYNPCTISGYNTVYAFDGELNDYYIETQEEFNNIIYYSFIWRKTSLDVQFSDESGITSSNSLYYATDTAFDSFAETRYFNFSYSFSNYNSANLGTIYISFISNDIYEDNIIQADPNFYENHTISSSLEQYKQLDFNTPYFNSYNYGTNKRDESYNDFTSNKSMIRLNVNTSEELYHAVENGFTPICNPGSRAEIIYNKAKEVLNSIIANDMSDFEKALCIFDWITINTKYDYTAVNGTTINGSNAYNYYFSMPCFYLEGVFLSGFAVCDGFSKAYSLLCNMEGIECIRIVGTANTGSGSGGHAWNKVKIDGNYYLVDITWTDMLVSLDGSINELLTHEYFLVTDSYTQNTHYPHAERTKFNNYATPTTSYNPYEKIVLTDSQNSSNTQDLVISSIEELVNLGKILHNNRITDIEFIVEIDLLESFDSNVTTNMTETAQNSVLKNLFTHYCKQVDQYILFTENKSSSLKVLNNGKLCALYIMSFIYNC